VTLPIIKAIVLACQVGSSTPSSSYEYVIARQRNCQRDLIKCVMSYAKDHGNPAKLSEWDLALCMADIEPELKGVDKTYGRDTHPDKISVGPIPVVNSPAKMEERPLGNDSPRGPEIKSPTTSNGGSKPKGTR
jgi:hypothetical protein